MLTLQQVEQFNTRGYTVCPGFLSADQVDALLAETARATHGHTLAEHDAERMEMEPGQAPEGTAVRRLYEPCSYYDVFEQLSEGEMLLDCVEQLFGPNLLFHYSKLNMKPAEVGSVVEWHQDLSYYPLTNTDSLAVLFYLHWSSCLWAFTTAMQERVDDTVHAFENLCKYTGPNPDDVALR